MKLTLLVLVLLASLFGLGQQIPCAKVDEQQQEYKSPEHTMRGCRSFNELLAAGGIKVAKGERTKPYACFATTFPEEGEDLFIFASLSGIENFVGDKVHNGSASMQTFTGGVEMNHGFAPMTWTQYPEKNHVLWSEGNWLGHGEAQLTEWNEETKSLDPWPDGVWPVNVPRLRVLVENDTVRLRLELNDTKGTVQTLDFNRRTGRALLGIGKKEQPLRCIPVGEQN
jgi:hypothetical protein